MRKVDTNNKNNVYCAHCEYFENDKYQRECWCAIGAKKHVTFFTRCKYFKWKLKYAKMILRGDI